MQQFGNVIDVNMTALVQHHSQRIGRRGDRRRRRRRDNPLGENRPRPRGIGFEVIIFNRSHQPAIGIIEKRLQVRPPMGFAHLAGGLVFTAGNRGEIDRAEFAHETGPGDAQLDLGRLPRTVLLLRLEYLPHRVPDRDQLADDACVFLRHAIGSPALPDGDGHGLPRDPLHQRGILANEVAAFPGGDIGSTIGHAARRLGGVDRDDFGFSVIDCGRKSLYGLGQGHIEIDAGVRQAGIGFAKWP